MAAVAIGLLNPNGKPRRLAHIQKCPRNSPPMMMADIQQNTEKLIGFSERVSKVENMVQSQAVSMARIDENIKAIRSSVEKMAAN